MTLDRPALNEQEQLARQELTCLMRLVLNGHCSYLEAAPRVLHLRSYVGGISEFDDDFMAFIAINSGADHLPLLATRHLWAEHAIKALEPGIAKMEVWAERMAKSSCLALLARFVEPGSC